MKPFICLVLMGCVCTLMGAALTVGIVTSTGDFRVDGSTIRGNSTVFEGNLIETAATRSTVQLGEARVTLAPNSSAKVFRDRTVLESGSELMRNGDKRTIEAATLQIAPEKDGVVVVAMDGPNNVKVFASNGGAQVRTAGGLLVASLRPGMGLAFTPQAGAATAMQMEGVLESANGRFFLTDSTSKTKAELRGTDLDKFKGKDVEVIGSVILGAAAVNGATQVVQVTKIEERKNRKLAGAIIPSGAGAVAGTTILGIGVAPAVILGGAGAAGATVGLLAAFGAGPFASNP